MRVVAILILMAAATVWPQPLPPVQVMGVGNFIHNVTDLDKSVAFYRDVLGMELQRPASAFQNTPEVLNLYNAAGGEYRVANAQIPGSPMRAELAEFRGVDRKPVRPKASDPGASILVLEVRQLGPVLERMAAAGLKALTPEPVKLAGGRGLIVADPDGFYVELLERATAPAGVPGNFIGMSFAYVVSDAEAMAQVLRSLRLEPTVSAYLGDSAEARMGLGKGAMRRAAIGVVAPGAGASFQLEFLELRANTARAAMGRPQDPGAVVLRLMVRETGAAVEALAKAGVKVVSAKGEIQTLPGAAPRRVAITAAPDNLFIQVMQ